MRAVAAGHDVTGYDTDLVRVKRLEAGESYVEDVPAGELAAAAESGRFRPSASADACAGFDVAVITVPTPLRDGQPDLAYVEAASRTLSRYLRPGTTVIVESTSYPGTTQEQVLAWLEDGSGLVAGDRLPPRLQPRAHRPGEPHLDPGHDAEDRIGHRRRLAGRGRELLPGHRGQDRRGLLAARGRAGQAHREHLPAREHRADERAGDVRPRSRRQRVGGDRRRGQQAVRVHAVQPRARGGWSLPAHRPVVPVLAGGADARPEVPVRGAGQRHQQPHARLRCPPAAARAEPARAARERVPDLAARARLQEEHRRRTGITRHPGRRSCC